MDALSDILSLLNLRASVYFHSSFCGSWSIDGDNDYRATFHLIARGNCWLHLPDSARTVALRGGDLIVFPRDIRHSISSSALTAQQTPPASSNADTATEEPNASLICGYFDFDSPQANPILDAMPDLIHIRNEDSARTSMLDSVLRFITQETENAQPGADVIVDRLSEVLFIHVVRAYMQQTGIKTGLLAALADHRLGRAIRKVHEQPAHGWSVSSLADQAGMSRSAFASHFQAVTGITPMQYVTGWRMQTAFEKLRTGNSSVADIAEQSGYQTEASFSKAFKKHMGIGPGAVRRGKLAPAKALPGPGDAPDIDPLDAGSLQNPRQLVDG
ncbi:MAG: AraC family transcriptional regulator [Thiotrichales bacterium]|nr:MAG: AraC family transcriptional regulator [Thiotrichales bacterium]